MNTSTNQDTRKLNGDADRMRIAEITKRIDEVTGHASASIPPSANGEPQRDAIKNVTDTVTQDLCNKIADFHKQLNILQDRVVRAAGSAQHSLGELVSVCFTVDGELRRLQTVIDEMSEHVTPIDKV